MSSKIVFLLEEPSMKELLTGLIPRFFPDLVFQCIPHQGKSDLDKSIPRKLSAWREPGIRFVIVRDNDNADPAETHRKLSVICAERGRPDTIVRLVCQELESWYIGDLAALEAAYPNTNVNTPRLKKKYHFPDTWHKPSVEVSRLVPEFQKRSGARLLGTFLAQHQNRSKSFNEFINEMSGLISAT